MKTFGSSAPLKDLQEKFGFTPEAVAKEAAALVGNSKRSP
jgi:transketolase